MSERLEPAGWAEPPDDFPPDCRNCGKAWEEHWPAQIDGGKLLLCRGAASLRLAAVQLEIVYEAQDAPERDPDARRDER